MGVIEVVRLPNGRNTMDERYFSPHLDNGDSHLLLKG